MPLSRNPNLMFMELGSFESYKASGGSHSPIDIQYSAR